MAEINDRAKLVVLAAALCWLVPLAALAITNPPYEIPTRLPLDLVCDF